MPGAAGARCRLPRALGPLSGPPADRRLRELLGWYGERTGNVTVRQADPLDLDAAGGRLTRTVLVSRPGAELSVANANRLAYQAFPLGADVDTIGGEWLAAAEVNRLHGRWITLFGFLGLCVLAAAAAVSAMADFLRNGRALAPVAGLAGNHRVHWSTAAVGILAPHTLAGVAGCTIGVWLAFPKTSGGASYIAGGLLAGCAAAVTVVGLVAWVWGAAVSVPQAARWRPRGGE